MNITKMMLAVGAFMLPAVALAQNPNTQPITNLVNDAARIVSLLIPIFIGVLFLVFIFGLIKYVLAAGDAEKKEDGKKIMVAGFFALFVVVSIWGLIRFFGGFLGLSGRDYGGALPAPTVEDLP